MSGGKGGSQTSKVQIPSWIEGPATRNLQRAEQFAQMGYQPYYGPEVAAFNPMQIGGDSGGPSRARGAAGQGGRGAGERVHAADARGVSPGPQGLIRG